MVSLELLQISLILKKITQICHNQDTKMLQNWHMCLLFQPKAYLK